jgi:hypothetical protein
LNIFFLGRVRLLHLFLTREVAARGTAGEVVRGAILTALTPRRPWPPSASTCGPTSLRPRRRSSPSSCNSPAAPRSALHGLPREAYRMLSLAHPIPPTFRPAYPGLPSKVKLFAYLAEIDRLDVPIPAWMSQSQLDGFLMMYI